MNARHVTGIAEGLERKGCEITSYDWIKQYQKDFDEGKKAHGKALIKSILSRELEGINIMANPYHYPTGRRLTDEELQKNGADTCIYVVARQAGEGADRSIDMSDYHISPDEFYNIRKVTEYFERVILVINAGSVIDLTPLDGIKKIGAVLFMCQLGMEMGNALADVLCGDVNPSGCLTDTWCNSYSDIPFSDEYGYLNKNPLEIDYKEGIFVGYRYFDTFRIPVRYPFGFGGSYTTFRLGRAEIKLSEGRISVRVLLENSGERYAGKRTVQVYVSPVERRPNEPYQKLIAFSKSENLEPGKSSVLKMSFPIEELAGYDEEQSSWCIEKGQYVLRIGFHSGDTEICAVLCVKERIITKKCTRLFVRKNPVTELERTEIEPVLAAEHIPRIFISPQMCSAENSRNSDRLCKSGEQDENVEELLNRLSLQERIDLLTGCGYMGGKSYFKAFGAAGNTQTYPEKGITNMVFCDGPAGLRLHRETVVKGKKSKPTESTMEFIDYFPAAVKKFVIGNPDKGELYYQFATAFPVGTALAQTWNIGLLEKVGDAVGREMEEFGITFWLAPGMNIHRNPLCGRNYEYFSEDPLLTGQCAAAITRGVQSHYGCFTTIKHFAANNQETERNHMSSNVSERTLREIYLKGYEIAIRESNPGGLMTSYNRLNGTYTSENEDLILHLLREEWGYSGLVMTDWSSTGKQLADPALSVKVGTDLIMPGEKRDRKRIAAALKSGELSIEAINTACRRILKALTQSNIQKEYLKG